MILICILYFNLKATGKLGTIRLSKYSQLFLFNLFIGIFIYVFIIVSVYKIF